MALLFVGGVMNLLWIAGLAILILLEKTLPAAGLWLPRISGVALATAGAWLLVGAP
jgi:predicted metal-binding membrane protein